MAVDVSQFEQRGAFWYQRGRKTPYEWKSCEACGQTALMRRRGRYCSRDCSPQQRPGGRRAGDCAAYSTWHSRVRAERGPASGYACADCGKPAEEWSMVDGSSSDVCVRFLPRCVRCHRQFDNNGSAIKGENNPGTKLADDDVREIRRQYAARLASQRQIGLEFGISQSTVGHIVRRTTWSHV